MSTQPRAPVDVPVEPQARQPIGRPSAPSRFTTTPPGSSRIRFAARRLGVEQALRLLGCAIAIAADHVWTTVRTTVQTAVWTVLGQRVGADSAELREAHLARSARRLAAVLGVLKGAFAKAGQFAAIRHDLLPPAVTDPLASLRDRVPPLPIETIVAIVEAELGAPIDALFEQLEPLPLGAASIAQVHRGVLRGGGEVAVKVQYPWLEGSLAADLWIVRTLLGWWSARRAGRRVDVDRIVDEFAAGLREELDFEREARVAVEVAANLAGDAQVVVPEIVTSHSSARVLTMVYRPAVRIDDASALADRGVDPAQLLEILARAYAKQVFVDGLFHADPHPGNLFVVDEPDAARRPRVLFVDFGLSRRLDPELRREMRAGIYALLQRDLDAFLAGMQRMDMIAPGAEPGVRAAVASMFEQIGAEGGALGVGGSQVLALKDRAKALLADTEGLQLPNDLLLYAKTLSYVFALGEQLAPQVDLMKLVLPYLLRYLAEKDPA